MTTHGVTAGGWCRRALRDTSPLMPLIHPIASRSPLLLLSC
jgi:hypothetical protein